MSGYIGVEPVPQVTKVRTFGTLDVASTTIPVAGGFSPGNIEVYINGDYVLPTDYDESDGLTIVFGITLDAGTDYVVIEARQFLVADTWSKQEADTRYRPQGYFHARDEKADGTSGGASVSGVQTRTLNTVVSNTITGASLATNQITLEAGTYRIQASCPATSVKKHKAYMYNNTTSTVSLIGSSDFSESDAPYATTHSNIRGLLVVPSTQTFTLRHYTEVARATWGLGLSSDAGVLEVYAEIEIFKEA
jgi:hypothetical protein